MILPHNNSPVMPLRSLYVTLLCLVGCSLFVSGCAQIGAGEHPPESGEFCAAAGWVEDDKYQGVVCLSAVDPLAEGARSDSYVLQPGPVRFVLPLEPSR
jgi:hypothetical protein